MPFSIRKAVDSVKSSSSSPDSISKGGAILSVILLGVLLFYISVWQFNFAINSTNEEHKAFGVHHSCGVSFSDPEHVFAYGLYYWGLFPMFPERSKLPEEYADDNVFYSKKGAEKILERHGYALHMDIDGTFRMGNVLNLWLPYLVAGVKGTTKDVNYIPFNAVYFITALLLLLCFFWFHGRGLLGLILVLVLGSYQFQIYSVYEQDNIFSYSISTIILVAALMIPLIMDFKLKPSKQALVCVVSGIWIGIAYLMRADCLSSLFACVPVILLYRHAKFKHRLALLLIFCFAFYATSSLMHTFFTYKFRQSLEIVKDKGGVPFEGRRLKNHLFWHTIWCGMYDFDRKYKHHWSDFVAEYKAKPVLEKKYGRKIGKMVYHSKPVDYYLPSRVPEYELAMRDLVFKDIKNDPLWYADILVKRVKRILFESIPPRVHFLSGHVIPLSNNILLYLLVLGVLIFTKEWRFLKLIGFSLGTVIVPLCVTTFSHYHYYSVVHLFLAAIFLYMLIKVLMHFSGQVDFPKIMTRIKVLLTRR